MFRAISFGAAMILAGSTGASAQNVTNIHSFGNGPGAYGYDPIAPLIASGHWLYGTAAQSDISWGNVFKIKTDGTGMTVLYNFNGYGDGQSPVGRLVLSSNVLYGTTYWGDGDANSGSVFKVNVDGTGFAVLYTFTNGADGAHPAAGLTLTNNMLYGTASQGGANGYGTIFELDTQGSNFVVLYAFSAFDNGTNADGAFPYGDLLLDGNALYGTASTGGAANAGTIFRLNLDGSNFTNLYSFTGLSDGNGPAAGLILYSNALYGTTEYGGDNGTGNVFKVNPDGSSLTTLYSFSALDTNNDNLDGAYPESEVTVVSNVIYGTAAYGGPEDSGTTFLIDTNGPGFSVLHGFSATESDNQTNSDGATPYAGLTPVGADLYGTASIGGPGGNGVVFKVHGTNFARVFDFVVPPADVDGQNPFGGISSSATTIYGTTEYGGTNDSGAIFKVNTDGTGYTLLYTFSAVDPVAQTNADGAGPVGGVILSGSTLYGTAQYGGVNGEGTFFSVSTNGQDFTTLHSFSALDTNGDNFDGAEPVAGLTLAGNTLYGAATLGGENGDGTLFAYDLGVTNFATLYSFSAEDTNYDNFDGAGPEATLTAGGNVLYGSAIAGGTYGFGTLFSFDLTNDTLTPIHQFTGGDDGAEPLAVLALSGSTLYGTATVGGANGDGAIYSLNTDGSDFNVLYSFSGTDTNGANADGAETVGWLLLSGNTLYGESYYGGQTGNGALFSIHTDGSQFTSLLSFDFTNGANPESSLVQIGNTLYGTTAYGGSDGNGSLFAFTLPTVPIPLEIAAAGTNVVLTWSNPAFLLQGSTNVRAGYTNISGAASPYITPVGTVPQFFRLAAGP